MSATAFQRKRRVEAAQLEKSQQVNDVEPDQDGLDDDSDANNGQQENQQDGEQTLDKLTNDQLKKSLDEKGIEYKKSATKAELIELLQGTDQ